MTQLVLPGMRAARHGRIVDIGSMGGRFVFPVGGYYHASKYAVEALTDALRFEAAPFGIKVGLIEPGLIRRHRRPVRGAQHHRPQADGRTPTPRLSATPDAVAAVIERALLATRPRARYVVTPTARTLVHTRRLLGGRAFDAYLRTQFRGTS